MNKLFSLLLFACLAVTGLMAQVSVSGTVFLGSDTGITLADYPVTLHAPTDGEVRTELIQTDENGNYAFNLANAVITESVDWTIETLDPCTLINVSRFFEVAPNELEYTIDLVVCDSINPPPPVDTCLAFFEFSQVDTLTFQFTTLTAAFLQVDSLRWDFGDGNTSDELAPVHTYTENGAYPVTLTVYTPTCTSVSTDLVIAFDANNCNCFDIYHPVCVFGPGGDVITFNNECEAVCSGYPFNQLFDCSDEGCVCPTFAAPVCVFDPVSQDTVTFINHCFAECEGFGPDQWLECGQEPIDTTGCFQLPANPVCATGFGEFFSFYNLCEYENSVYFGFPLISCDSIPGNCNCPEIYDPVCVISPNGFPLSFSNSCFAECAGYGQDQQFTCLTDSLDCNFFPFPVCVATSNLPDSLIYFETACAAIDAGFTYDDLLDCGNANECTAQINYYVASSDGLTYDFQATNPNGSSFITYNWNFGDGTTSNAATPRHVFAAYGEYTVMVDVTIGDCTTSEAIIVTVAEGNGNYYDCQAFFFFEQPDSTSLLTYQFVNFTYFTSDFPLSVIWDFGDGTTSTELNPRHTFPSEGSYTVTLSVDDNIGCQSSIAIAINAGENIWYGDLECRAWFLPLIDVQNNQVYFINWSSYDAVEYFWDFGDGTLSNDFEVLHQYADAGIYTVTLTTTSSSGCVNTYSVTIDIGGNNFTSNPTFRLLSSIDEAGKVTQPLIKAFPNPTRDLVTVQWENGTSGNFGWSLFDVSGRELQSSKGHSTTATNRFNVDLSQQPAGMYFLRVRTPEGLQVVRLSKTE